MAETLQQKRLKASRANFKFGNDEWVKRSSHQCDFGLNRNIQMYRIPKQVPPKPAQIFPSATATELSKWKSSTKQDFESFGADARRSAYEATTRGFLNVKTLQNLDEGFLRENCRQTMTSRYNADFGKPCMYSMESPAFRQQVRRLYPDKGPKNTQFISEATHAFQWPSSERVKLPPHLRANTG
ncbi:hypothetical protein ACF0H5_011717 [Mactra antiquata]